MRYQYSSDTSQDLDAIKASIQLSEMVDKGLDFLRWDEKTGVLLVVFENKLRPSDKIILDDIIFNNGENQVLSSQEFNKDFLKSEQVWSLKHLSSVDLSRKINLFYKKQYQNRNVNFKNKNSYVFDDSELTLELGKIRLTGSGKSAKATFETQKYFLVYTDEGSKIPVSDFQRIQSLKFLESKTDKTQVRYGFSIDYKQTWVRWSGTGWEVFDILNFDSEANSSEEIQGLALSDFDYFLQGNALHLVIGLQTEEKNSTPLVEGVIVNYQKEGYDKLVDNYTEVYMKDLTTTEIKNISDETIYEIKAIIER